MTRHMVPVDQEAAEAKGTGMSEETKGFEEWWERDGMYIDPDTSDVPWFDKRKGLAECAFVAGMGRTSPKAEFRLHTRDKAVYEILSSDPNLMNVISGIYERIPQSVAFPYVTFGDASENAFLLHVWTREGGRKEAATIMERLHFLLAPAYKFVTSKIALGADGWTYEGDMEFGTPK
jgi:hypothetical protein